MIQKIIQRLLSFTTNADAEVLRLLNAQSYTKDTIRHVDHAFSNDMSLISVIQENNLISLLFDTVIHKDCTSSALYASLFDKYILAQMNIHASAIEYFALLRGLNERGIKYTSLKSTFFFSTSTHSLHKEVNDLDILVRTADFASVAKYLYSRGYKRLHSRENPLELDSRDVHGFYCPKEEEFFYKAPFAVEVHTNIVQTSGFYNNVFSLQSSKAITQEFACHTKRIRNDGIYISVLEKNYLVLNMCIHTFYSHGFQSVLQYYELLLLIRSKGTSINWNVCEDMAKRYGIHSYFIWYLCIFDSLFPRQLPRYMRARVLTSQNNWSIVQRLAFRVIRLLVFYPKSHKISDFWKKVIWATVDARCLRSIGRYVQSIFK